MEVEGRQLTEEEIRELPEYRVALIASSDALRKHRWLMITFVILLSLVMIGFLMIFVDSALEGALRDMIYDLFAPLVEYYGLD